MSSESSSSSSSTDKETPEKQEDTKTTNKTEDDDTGDEVNEEPAKPQQDIHKFKFVLKNIQIYNVRPFDSVTSDPYLYFTLGGNFKIEDLRHRFGLYFIYFIKEFNE